MSSTEWLNKYLSKTASQELDINGEKYIEVRNFLFLWNMVEEKLFGTHCDANAIGHFNKKLPQEEVINDVFLYMAQCYIENNTTSNRFENLRLSNSVTGNKQISDKDKIKNILLNQMSDMAAKFYAIMMIVFRYRCNLFHGEKRPNTLWLQYQQENFKFANDFLIACLEANN